LLGTEAFGYTDGTFIPIGPVPDINNAGQISFRAILTGNLIRGLIVSTKGVHEWYVKNNEATPAGGTYFDFQAASINESGQIAFFADYKPTPVTNSSGWFAGAPSPVPESWRKVLAFFDPLEGGQCFGLAFSRNPMQAIDEDGNVLVWTDVQLTGGGMQERLLINRPDGTYLTVARQGDPTPLGGTYGTLQAWSCLNYCGGTFGSGTPGAPGGVFNAHFVFQRCKPGDATGDCTVNVDDLLAVINAWGPCPAPPAECPADFNDDGNVNVDDLLIVINNWG
jgi:hypothetical protein